VTPSAFAHDVAARAARIGEALADGETHLALDMATGLEEDALAIAEAFEADELSEAA
jgi:hypothetical protein